MNRKLEILIKTKKLLEVRVYSLSEIRHWLSYLIDESIPEYDKNLLTSGKNPGIALEVLMDSATFLMNNDVERFEGFARHTLCDKYNTKLGSVLHPIRVAISGKTISLPLFESMCLLGTDICLERLKNAINKMRDDDD